MLVKAAGYNTVDILALMSDLGNLLSVTDEVQAYITGQSDELSDSTWAILHVVDRFMLYNGIGQHPSDKGVEQKWLAVKKAYEKYCPKYETLRDIVVETKDVAVMIRDKSADPDVIKSKLAHIRSMIKSLRKGKYDTARLNELVKQLDKYDVEVKALEQAEQESSSPAEEQTETSNIIAKIKAKLVVSKTAVTLRKGKLKTISAKVVNAETGKKLTALTNKIKYSSSNSKIATVSSKGVIKGKKKGTCYITVSSSEAGTRKIKVTITK
jgi:hypothetical protein